MPRSAPTLAFALLLAGCGHAGGDASPPAPPDAVVATRPRTGADAPIAADRTAAQQITFEDDDAGPAPAIRSAPKRPPIPAFELFGTRPGDGP